MNLREWAAVVVVDLDPQHLVGAVHVHLDLETVVAIIALWVANGVRDQLTGQELDHGAQFLVEPAADRPHPMPRQSRGFRRRCDSEGLTRGPGIQDAPSVALRAGRGVRHPLAARVPSG